MNTNPSLKFCIIMDLIGYSSYFIPFIGEGFDICWAPISAYIFYKTFSGKKIKVLGKIGFLEELLPYTDFIPTFTISYFFQKYKFKDPYKHL